MKLIQCPYCNALFNEEINICPCCKKEIPIEVLTNLPVYDEERLKNCHVFMIREDLLIKNYIFQSIEIINTNFIWIKVIYNDSEEKILWLNNSFLFLSYADASKRRAIEHPSFKVIKIDYDDSSTFEKILFHFPTTVLKNDSEENERVYYRKVIEAINKKINNVKASIEKTETMRKQAFQSMYECMQEDATNGKNLYGDSLYLSTNAQFDKIVESNKFYNQQIDFLLSLKKKPYFVRMDCGTSFDKLHTIYMGYNEIENYVVDWRSNAAEFYYNSDMLISKGILVYSLKRMFTSFNNGDVQFEDEINCTNKFMTSSSATNKDFEKEELNIHDDVYLRLIEEARKKPEVHEIIATLKQMQYQIIIEDYHKNMIVNGCAGSGKTMILYHRLSHMIFNEKRKNLKFNCGNIFILSPSLVFQKSMTELSKTLELDKTQNLTFFQFIENLIFLYSKKRYILPGIKTTIEIPAFDSTDASFYTEERYQIFKNEFQATNINTFNFKYWLLNLINEEFHTHFEYFSFYQSNGQIDLSLLDKIKPKIKTKEGFFYPSDVILQASIATIRGWLKKNKKDENKYFERIKKYRPMMSLFLQESNMSIVDKNLAYVKIYEDDDLLNIALQYLILTKIAKEYNQAILGYQGYFDNIKCMYVMQMYEKIFQLDSQKKYFFERLYYLKYLEEQYGCFYTEDSWCFVDEYQNYSIFEIGIISTAFSNVTMNFYGDLNQRLEEKGIQATEKLIKLYPETKVFTVNENFRNAQEITDYINKELRMSMVAIGIHGTVIETTKEKVHFQVEKRTAIICKDISNFKSKYFVFNLNIITSENDEIKQNQINLIDVKDTKGLEFDTVYVFLENMTETEKYLSMSRALNNLIVVK